MLRAIVERARHIVYYHQFFILNRFESFIFPNDDFSFDFYLRSDNWNVECRRDTMFVAFPFSKTGPQPNPIAHNLFLPFVPFFLSFFFSKYTFIENNRSCASIAFFFVLFHSFFVLL